MWALFSWLLWLIAIPLKALCWYPLFTLSIGSYVAYYGFISLFYKTQNLKRRYNAEWALVTGASSGIGKAIAKKLAKQGLNVVLVALDDHLLNDTFQELVAEFPALQFRKVGVNLGTPGYLPAVAEATKDVLVQIVFANAGYMLTGFFHERPMEQQLQNFECNAGSAVQVTHHFLQLLVKSGRKGCFVFTSSAAAMMPSPFTVLYAATKAFLSSFGAGLAAEVKHRGIDVLVFHPSPVASRFYEKAHKLDVLKFFVDVAVAPEDLPDPVFASIGRTVWSDVGGTALAFRLMMKVLDFNMFASVLAAVAHMMPDFKKQALKIEEAKKQM